MAGTVEEYVEKISRLTKEYKQLIRKEAKYVGSKDDTLAEIKERKLSIYKYIKGKASKCTDERIAFVTLIFGAKMFKYLPKEYQSKEFFLNAVTEINSTRIFKYASSSVTSDRECVITAIKKDPTMFQYASEALKKDAEIISLYQWKSEVASIPKELPKIDLNGWGPDEDDKFFKLTSSSSTGHSEAEQSDDEPDYDDTQSIAPTPAQTDDDEPDYDDQVNPLGSSNQVQKFDSEWDDDEEGDDGEGRESSQLSNNIPKERDILSDDFDDELEEATLIPEDNAPEKKKEDKKEEKKEPPKKVKEKEKAPETIDTSVDDYEGEDDNTPDWEDDDQTLMPGELLKPEEAPKRKGIMGLVDKFLK